VEVERKLADKGVEPAVIARALARLDELGLIDDADYAARYVEHRREHRPEGARAVRQALARRGVARGVIDEVTAGIDEGAAALALALDRAPRYAGCDRPAFERRLGGLLQRRGFGPDAVRAAVRAAWERRGEER
jgi:regulatory protein